MLDMIVDAVKQFKDPVEMPALAIRACLVRNRVGPGGAKNLLPGGLEAAGGPFCGAASSVLEARLAKRAIDESSAHASACKTV